MRHPLFISALFLLLSSSGFSQINSLEIDPVKEKMYSPYMLWRHQGAEGLAEFKKNKPHEYLKELWYYSESFYIKRNHLKTGETLDVSIIDISRFEHLRKQEEESMVELPGFKDVIILLPINKLIYKP
ncbi:MAG: hypothetical protein JNK73_13285 [Bacteroidia bacterium]|nr:hypothetical protein [Bacteroidia bacterium]